VWCETLYKALSYGWKREGCILQKLQKNYKAEFDSEVAALSDKPAIDVHSDRGGV